MEGRLEDPYDLLERILAGVANPRDLPLPFLEDITEHFSEERKIGEGGFGTVYKGVFRNQNVAVKKISVNKYTVDDKLFHREVNRLMVMNNHPNLVRFLGFCSNTARSVKEITGTKEIFYHLIMDRLLCFEYISNGSLDKHITDELRGLTWDTRFDIITRICEGLRYLHVDKSIIHMDLKPANILLDDHMVPKITDFGLSRSAENTHTQGERFFTRGYCAPEYLLKDGQISCGADIYSLGVIIIELVTGSKCIPDRNQVLRRWRHRWNRPPTQHQHRHQVIKCMDIAVRCREQEPEKRPSITDIIRDLSETESTNGLIGPTSIYLYDDMLGIEPLELHFPSEHNKQTSRSVVLTNETSNSIAFNIQTPSEQYNTLPNKGVVLPGGKRAVKIITVQPQESAMQVINAAKFVVQSTQVSEGLSDEHITDHMFKSKGGKKVVDNVNLMVVHEPKKHQVDLSLDRQEQELSKDIGSSSYKNTRYMHFDSLESISRNLATSSTSDRTVDLSTGAIGSLLPKLSELLNKYSPENCIRSNVDCVIQELRVMRADLCNVSEVQRDNNNEHIKLAKIWACEVRELSYDIEDVVDGFLTQVEGSEQATSTGGLLELKQKIGGAIEDIKNQLQNKASSKGKHKVDEVFERRKGESVGNTVSSIHAHFLSALHKNSNKLIGIHDSMKDFTEKFRGAHHDKLKVHSIFGIGGLGKTTLARVVYNQLKGSFDLTAFVPVGQKPDVKKLLCDILFELDESMYINLKATNLDENQLIGKVRMKLLNKRYLIVIDDMWDKKVWHDSLRFAFVDSQCGSKIIITTRIFEVATIATDVYKLNRLSVGYSEELFYATLSPEKGRHECDVTKEVINKILSKCGGVPLAIITIASMLASKQREDWPKVYNSIGFGPEGNEDADITRKILFFSYSDLPRHLRTCLLHLSIFPEDRLIDKDTVIWMWVGEGFVPEEPGRGLFEVGERFFNQLVSRSMIQLMVDTGFRIHDLVLDMICSLSKDENFVTVLEKDEQETSSTNKARRLAVQKRGTEKQDLPDCMGQLRSFYAIDCLISVMQPLPSFKVLRVLSMEGCGFIVDETYHLEHIGKLLQLRYLRLEGLPIEELPEEIGNLLFLQTLILNYNDKIKELPRSICLLRQLKCLRAICCDQLEVPDWIGKMTSLEDLYVDFRRPVDETSLEGPKLTRVVGEGLGQLKELRDLYVDFNCSSYDSWNRAVVSCVVNLPKLQSLKVTMWSLHRLELQSCHDPIWEGFVPPRHLHRLELRVGLSCVPAWMDSTHLPSLSHLDLSLSNIGARCLEILGTLPELHTLKLFTWHSSWLTVTGSGAFPKLRYLSSRVMLRFQQGVMPQLEYLDLEVSVRALKNANSFSLISDITSLGNLPSLQIVQVVMLDSDSDWTCIYAKGILLDLSEYTTREYAKEMAEALKLAVATHPRRPVLHLL